MTGEEETANGHKHVRKILFIWFFLDAWHACTCAYKRLKDAGGLGSASRQSGPDCSVIQVESDFIKKKKLETMVKVLLWGGAGEGGRISLLHSASSPPPPLCLCQCLSFSLLFFVDGEGIGDCSSGGAGDGFVFLQTSPLSCGVVHFENCVHQHGCAPRAIGFGQNLRVLAQLDLDDVSLLRTWVLCRNRRKWDQGCCQLHYSGAENGPVLSYLWILPWSPGWAPSLVWWPCWPSWTSPEPRTSGPSGEQRQRNYYYIMNTSFLFLLFNIIIFIMMMC